MTINIENFKILRDAVASNPKFAMEDYVHECGSAACIVGSACAVLDIEYHANWWISEEAVGEWLGITREQLEWIEYGDWSTASRLEDIPQAEAVAYLDSVIATGIVMTEDEEES